MDEDDVFMHIVHFLDWHSFPCLVCGTCHRYRDSFGSVLCRVYFPMVRRPSPSLLSAACLIMQECAVLKDKQDRLLYLLNADVRLFARRVDKFGRKRDDEFWLYRVHVVDFGSGMYRYSRGARVVGDRSVRGVYLDRIFAWTDDDTDEHHEDNDDRFDDDGAKHRLVRLSSQFSRASDQCRLATARPVFGFHDDEHIMARSMSSVVINSYFLPVRLHST